MATQVERLSAFLTQLGTDWKNIWANTGNKNDLSTTTKVNLVAAINEVNNKPTASGGASIADGDTGTSTTTTYSAKKITDDNAAQNTVIAGKALLSHTHTLSQITDAATKANDVSVVHLTGVETITGAKTFSAVTNFTLAPAVPDSAFTITKTSGLQAALDAKAMILDSAAITDTTKVWSAKKTNDAIEAAKTYLTGGANTAFDTFGELQALMQADDTETAGIITALGQRLKVDGTAQTISIANAAVARTNIDAAQASAFGNPDTDYLALYTAAKA